MSYETTQRSQITFATCVAVVFFAVRFGYINSEILARDYDDMLVFTRRMRE